MGLNNKKAYTRNPHYVTLLFFSAFVILNISGIWTFTQAYGQSIGHVETNVSPSPTHVNMEESPTPSPTRSVTKNVTDSTEPAATESFSQITLFLFGSGVAFFIALLAWSDQIRAIDNGVRALEDRFLEKTHLEKSDFLRIVKPKTADDRGFALLQVRSSGLMKTKSQAEVLQIFTRWNQEWSSIEFLTAGKYYLTITLTVVLFTVGIASLFTTASSKASLLSMQWTVEKLLLIPPAINAGALIIILICVAVRERTLRSIFESVSDMV